MQHRGVDVGHVVPIFDGVKTERVGGAVGDAAFEPAAGHHHRESERVMVAPVAALRAGRAAEFGADHHQRFIQHAALFQVLQ